VTIFWKATAGDHGAAANDTSWPQPLILVLQRELLPNLSLLTLITRAGLEVVGPFTRVSQARTWIESNRPDAAVLDVVLWDSLAFDLAGALTRRGIPILFYTSWTDTSLIPAELRAMPFLEKPVHLVLVARLLTRMIADGQVLEVQAEEDSDWSSVSDPSRRRASADPCRPYGLSANDPEDLSDWLEIVAGESR
jgi:DNA-binding LytR/AlgR family response regulator